MSKQTQRRRKKSVTPAVIRYDVQVIIMPEWRNALHQLFLSSNNKFYHHYSKFDNNQNLLQCRRLIAKETDLCASILTYLCSNTDLYSMLINLSKLTTSRKLVVKVTETRLLIKSRKQLIMNQVLCLTLIIREPHSHLI